MGPFLLDKDSWTALTSSKSDPLGLNSSPFRRRSCDFSELVPFVRETPFIGRKQFIYDPQGTVTKEGGEKWLETPQAKQLPLRNVVPSRMTVYKKLFDILAQLMTGSIARNFQRREGFPRIYLAKHFRSVPLAST